MQSEIIQRSPSHVADDLFRREGARLVASLAAHLGTHRLQLAEDVVQEALVRALQTWPYRGIPENPAAWLTQAAKNLALDALRREQTWQRKELQITAEQERWLTRDDEPADEHTLPDDTLRMLFVCFHPQLSSEAQLALALRTVCGLSPAEIGAAFFTSEAAIAKRLVRARQLIRDLRLPFAVPGASELPQRLDGVLAALYLLFNEGYKASSGDRLIREELCHEAIRLTRLLAAHPATSQPATKALLALMCLNAARLRARVSPAGEIVRLHQQDRGQWDAALIAEGIQAIGAASSGEIISSYHIEAGIAACHCLAADEASTDWTRILNLYDQLLLLKPTPIVAMNRSVALARMQGPRAGLEALENIRGRHSLEARHLYHAIRACFIAKLGHPVEARAAWRRAAELAPLETEREFLQGQATECVLGHKPPPMANHDGRTRRSSPMLSTFRILLTLLFATWLPVPTTSALEPVRVSRDGQSFVLAGSNRPFRVWGVNYDHDSEGENGRLIEDYWHDEWETVRADFREMRDLGANVVRVHLQLGRFMPEPDKADEKSLARLRKLLALAEETGLYLDLTGLGCYHKADTPPWYDAMGAPARWQVQARFWAAIARTCCESPAVFCYDLMNEPVIGGKKEEGWLAGELGGKHFVQRLALDTGGRTQVGIAKEWATLLTKAIRAEDPAHLITVGVIPWAHTWPGAKPVFYAPEVIGVFDFVSIHLYPEKGGVEKALAALAVYDLGKPLVIEETFPLNCTLGEMDEFLKKSRARVEGHVSFYWGRTIEELSAATEKKEIAALIAQWLGYFRDQAGAMKRPLDPKAGRESRE